LKELALKIRNPLLDLVDLEFFEWTKFEKKITCKSCGTVLLDSSSPGDPTREADAKRLCLHFELLHGIHVMMLLGKGKLPC